jgi:hypothetical protein
MTLSTPNILIYSAQILVLIGHRRGDFPAASRRCPTRLLASRGGRVPYPAVGLGPGQRASGVRGPIPHLEDRLPDHGRDRLRVVAVHSVCSAVAAPGRRRTPPGWRLVC